MGQRLNVEIKYGGELLANAYYHWSGYTSSSVETTSAILKDISKIGKIDDPLQTAVQLLFNTGARFANEEITDIRKESGRKEKYVITDDKPVSRNDGLICISQKGMEETRHWEEARVEIDLKSQEVDFNALGTELADSYEEYRKECEWESQDKLPILDPDPEDSIPFDKWNIFAERVLKMIENRQYIVNSKSGELVYFFIE